MAKTEGVLVGVTATSLKDLLETAGWTFPNDNDSCSGITLQLDPTTAENVEVSSEGATYGIILSADPSVGAPSESFQEYRIGNVYLKASAADVLVRVRVEHRGC